jgi:hypothetical protein
MIDLPAAPGVFRHVLNHLSALPPKADIG